jgi:hypothetical protein
MRQDTYSPKKAFHLQKYVGCHHITPYRPAAGSAYARVTAKWGSYRKGDFSG